MRKLAFLIALLCVASVKAQTVSNLGGAGSLQFFNDDGSPLTNGMVYIFQAQSSTPVAVYVDSGGQNQQPNPVPLGGNGRAQIWLANGTFVKIVLCSSNTDGAFCAAGHTLFSADNIAIGSSSGGGGGSPFTGVFISSTATPATSGILRLSSGDSICWRNAAGSANLCVAKDSIDIFSIPTSWKLPPVAAPGAQVGFGQWWFDNSANRLKMSNNGGTADTVAGAATLDTFTNKTFDAQGSGNNFKIGGVSISSTGQSSTTFLRGDGTWAGIEGIITYLDITAFNASPAIVAVWTWANVHTITRFRWTAAGVFLANAPSGCTTNAIIAVRDETSATNLTSLTFVNGTASYDSGVISIATTAGHNFSLKISTAPAGCTTSPEGAWSVTYQ